MDDLNGHVFVLSEDMAVAAPAAGYFCALRF
jgi:hypothetical protein